LGDQCELRETRWRHILDQNPRKGFFRGKPLRTLVVYDPMVRFLQTGARWIDLESIFYLKKCWNSEKPSVQKGSESTARVDQNPPRHVHFKSCQTQTRPCIFWLCQRAACTVNDLELVSFFLRGWYDVLTKLLWTPRRLFGGLMRAMLY
jgi:hypothetical protein